MLLFFSCIPVNYRTMICLILSQPKPHLALTWFCLSLCLSLETLNAFKHWLFLLLTFLLTPPFYRAVITNLYGVMLYYESLWQTYSVTSGLLADTFMPQGWLLSIKNNSFHLSHHSNIVIQCWKQCSWLYNSKFTAWNIAKIVWRV